mmetsp:Transcript_32625/g.68183  ORF Transcript_32625/g.68183 Transcript_32625/m.68183 type:complete len:120 (-) Transcript_32625:438-797(-)
MDGRKRTNLSPRVSSLASLATTFGLTKKFQLRSLSIDLESSAKSLRMKKAVTFSEELSIFYISIKSRANGLSNRFLLIKSSSSHLFGIPRIFLFTMPTNLQNRLNCRPIIQSHVLEKFC